MHTEQKAWREESEMLRDLICWPAALGSKDVFVGWHRSRVTLRLRGYEVNTSFLVLHVDYFRTLIGFPLCFPGLPGLYSDPETAAGRGNLPHASPNPATASWLIIL